jgi:hypothetical protein
VQAEELAQLMELLLLSQHVRTMQAENVEKVLKAVIRAGSEMRRGGEVHEV